MVDSIKGKKQNKGEWAEFYVLLKLLGEGKLYSANKLLQKNYQSYLDVLRVIRHELETQVLEYIIDKDNSIVIIRDQNSNEVLSSIPMKEFSVNASLLFTGIKDMKGSSIPAPDDVCDFARIIYVSKPKAPSLKALKKQFGGKNDIIIEVKNSQTSIVSVMGFSIKSKFGNSPTLFNAGASSQFMYKLSGCNDDLMGEFNSFVDGEKRIWSKCKEFLSQKGITMEFVGTKNANYMNNLSLVRESMSQIMAWCVKDRLIDSSRDYKVMETIERMIKVNPLNVPNPAVYYEKAVKDFLMAGFTGMTAAEPWDGKEQVNGGYICVMDNGDVLCYHSNDREAFRDYLYRNTYFEYVDSKKFKWSWIEKIKNEYLLPLNVSVRFNKKIR